MKKLAEEIGDHMSTHKTTAQIHNIPKEVTGSKRVEMYVANIGGPLKLQQGSAAKQMYEAVTFWDTGLLLARKGYGSDAVNLLFRGLMTHRRGCTHVYFQTGNPNMPGDGSFRWLGLAVEALNRRMAYISTKAQRSQVEYMQKVMEFKLNVVKSYFSESFREIAQGLQEIKIALSILEEARKSYTKETVPKDPEGMVLWLEGESFFSDKLYARVKSMQGSLLTLMTQHASSRNEMRAYNREALNAFDMALSIDPTFGLSLIGKANNLHADLDEIKQSFQCYQKAIEVFPDDDTEKAVASYQYAFGVLMGMIESTRNVGMLKGLIQKAKDLEELSYPLFGQSAAEGKAFCESFLKELKQFKDDETFPAIDPFTHPITNPQGAAAAAAKMDVDVRQICVKCNSEFSRLMRCEKCKEQLYCSSECMQADWPEHSKTCRSV